MWNIFARMRNWKLGGVRHPEAAVRSTALEGRRSGRSSFEARKSAHLPATKAKPLRGDDGGTKELSFIKR
jgi:hypothetical protein